MTCLKTCLKEGNASHIARRLYNCDSATSCEFKRSVATSLKLCGKSPFYKMRDNELKKEKRD